MNKVKKDSKGRSPELRKGSLPPIEVGPIRVPIFQCNEGQTVRFEVASFPPDSTQLYLRSFEVAREAEEFARAIADGGIPQRGLLALLSSDQTRLLRLLTSSRSATEFRQTEPSLNTRI